MSSKRQRFHYVKNCNSHKTITSSFCALFNSQKMWDKINSLNKGNWPGEGNFEISQDEKKPYSSN